MYHLIPNGHFVEDREHDETMFCSYCHKDLMVFDTDLMIDTGMKDEVHHVLFIEIFCSSRCRRIWDEHHDEERTLD